MSVTITIPADLEQRIAGVAAAQGKNVQQAVADEERSRSKFD
jgi:hypothetical protein